MGAYVFCEGGVGRGDPAETLVSRQVDKRCCCCTCKSLLLRFSIFPGGGQLGGALGNFIMYASFARELNSRDR